ncbi:MAG: GGDEF domain-containing protein [Deltaproteobacteria bacterium]|jgi:diguanylate cyclase (GGDEF)-like protein|nr:GGDEF domain-containing protein [Deltaproteobacteria bacterium]MBW2532896.1 GGDEF domain-containing protein [Deltaproteobacteria bacterium]
MASSDQDDPKPVPDLEATMQLSKEKLAEYSTKHLAKVAPDDGGVLLLLGGTYGERQYDVNKAQMTIGRDPSVEIIVDADGVSRRHARVLNDEGTVTLEDLGSTNGTLLNNARMTAPTKLSEDDLIQVGAAVFKYLPAGCQELMFLRKQENAARTDPLTGVANKRCLLETLEMHFELSRRREDSLSVVILDIDHFKKVNDTYGHDVGDIVLKDLAARIQDSAVRRADVLGRFGGEEFVVVLPSAAIEQGIMVAERIRFAVAEKPFQAGETMLPVTVSCGVAALTAAHGDASQLLKSADEALYRAKSSGRNKVCQASS